MVGKPETETQKVSDRDFREAVKKLLDTPPQHKPSKKPAARKARKILRDSTQKASNI